MRSHACSKCKGKRLKKEALAVLANGLNISTIQELLGHKNVKTTMISTHVLKNGVRYIMSPMDSYDKIARDFIRLG
jgi:excinuclease UvrABC ATPase subunit